MEKKVTYVSETTNFIRDLLKTKPELKAKQKNLRKTFWDVGFADLDEEKRFEESSVKPDGYVYYTYPKDTK